MDTLIDWATIWIILQVIGGIIGLIIIIPIFIFVLYNIWKDSRR